MRIAEKLGRLHRRAGEAPPGASTPALQDPAPPAPPPLPSQAPGPAFLRRETRIPLASTHGAVPLAGLATLAHGDLALLGDATDLLPAGPASSEATIDPEAGAAVFFDTETTSLASGAGVTVFLAGFARVEGADLLVTQLWLADLTREREYLGEVAAHVSRAPLLVSYSGRGFDERRLEDRFRFQGLKPPFARGRHADLCPLARSLWKGRLPSCSLSVIEPAHLGLARMADLPGERCPEAYFQSLRGDAAAREAVLRHNLVDIVSLAALALEMRRRSQETTDPRELLGLGLHHARRRRAELALRYLERALAAEQAKPSLPRPERAALHLALARALRRAGRGREAGERLTDACRGAEPPLLAVIELARHAEHTARDLSLARRAAAFALSRVLAGERSVTPARRAALEADLRKRLSRLEMKQSKETPRGP